MKIYEEKSLNDFEFWSGAKDRVKYLTDDDLEQIEDFLNTEYPDGISDTELNDIFWFEEDFIAQMLGYSNFDELMKDRKELQGTNNTKLWYLLNTGIKFQGDYKVAYYDYDNTNKAE